MEPIIDRIRKLLALAGNNPNENEAGAALAKAHELMALHGIKHIHDKVEESRVRQGQAKFREYDQKWHIFLASGIARLYQCRTTVGNVSGITFWGRSEHIEVAEMTFVHVASEIERFYKLTLKEFGGELGKAGRANLRASFKQAAAIRIQQRVETIIAEAQNRIPDHHALVVVTTGEIDEAFKKAGIRVGKAIKVTQGLGTGAGIAAGDAVKLQRAVAS